jgi:ATP-binding cassette subfamily C protein
VRAHAREAGRLGLIATRSLASVEIGRAVTKVRNVFNGGINVAEFLGLAAVLAVGFRQVDAGLLTVGAATTGALFFQRFFAPVSVLLAGIDDLQRAEVGLSRLVGVLRVPVRSAVPATDVPEGAVTLEGVCFSYPGTTRRVLDGVSLEVAPRSRVVLVGASGSGKSTVARLVAGSLRPDGGSVRVGGRTLLVAQEIHRFTGTVAENLRLVAPEASDEDLLAATDAVGAAWVRTGGLDSDAVLDEAAVQQLALARVLLADPPVVVLDEATAHAGTDDRLDAAVDAVTCGRTSLIVAHRLSQAAGADLVVMLDAGRIVEAGPHEVLVAGGGRYARLWAAWRARAR